MMLAVLAATVLLALAGTRSARALDDDLLAHRLYVEGRYAEAAELFTDPAWKGVALYRSRQWWRAADAFVRADDARSAANLGNAYVKLGYHALALDAYRRALELEPDLDDARHNADVMVRVLALEERGEGGGRSPSEEEIERVEREGAEEREADPSPGEGGDEESEREEGGPGENEPGEEEGDGSEESAAGDDGETEDAERDAERGDGAGAVNGTEGERDASDRASGVSESDSALDGARAAGTRGDIESEQATAQWLARIAHDPRRFLERRIALELRRRRAAGHAAPEGGDGW